MSSARYFVSPHQLWSLIGTAGTPDMVDVRRETNQPGQLASDCRMGTR